MSARGTASHLWPPLWMAIGSFVASTVASEIAIHKVDARTREISQTALPSIVALASVRTELFRAASLLERDRLTVASERGPIRRQMLAALASARSDVEGFLGRATSAGDRALATALRSQLEDVDRAFGLALAAQDFAGEQRETEQQARPAVSRAEATALDLIELNIGSATADADAIEHDRVQSTAIACALDVLSALFTLALGLLSWRAFRQQLAMRAAHEQRLAAQAAELDAFAGRVAHDILNPICTAALAFDLLGRDARRPEVAARGKASIARAHGVVEALLCFARAGAEPQPDGHCNLSTVLHGAIEDVASTAPDSVSIQVQVAQDVEAGCPPGVLASIAGNLISNAVKYGRDNTTSPHVEVRAARHGAWVRVEVEDHGPGIPADLAASVFLPFVRGHDVGQPGVGLGLATAKRLCEAHRGRIGFNAAGEAGTTFWFELPAAQPQASA